MPRLYFENAMARIVEHPSGYVLLSYHAGARTLQDVQGILTHTDRLLMHKGWGKMLSDQRELSPFTEEEKALILTFWQERARTLGPVTGAVVLSSNAVTRLSFHMIREHTQGALRYQLFEQLAEAESWLRQQA